MDHSTALFSPMPPYGSAVGLATLFVSQEITTEVRFHYAMLARIPAAVTLSLLLGRSSMNLDELAVDDLTRLGLASKSFTSIVTGYRTSKKGKAPVPPLAVVIDLTGSDDDEIGILSFRRSVRHPFSFPSECLHMLTDQHQSEQTRTDKPLKPTSRLFVSGTE